MKITVVINTDNQAFDTCHPAFYRIDREEMKYAIEQVGKAVDELIVTNWDYPCQILDSNGNTVGYVEIESEKLLGNGRADILEEEE